MFTALLTGDMPSKKNAWKRTRTGSVYIDSGMRSQLDDFLWQLRGAKRVVSVPLRGPLSLSVTFTAGARKDLDNMTTTLMDLLQSAGIIENDRHITELHAKRIECPKKGEPYLELTLGPVIHSDNS